MKTITEETYNQLYAKYGQETVDRLLSFPHVLEMVEGNVIMLSQAKHSEIDWEDESKKAVEYRVYLAYISITSGVVSQNKVCELLKLSPVTYRKHRDSNIESLKQQYDEYHSAVYNASVEVTIFELVLYQETLDNLGIKNIDKFMDIMNTKGFGDLADDMNKCFKGLTEEEKKLIC
jgi:hypothetical protein